MSSLWKKPNIEIKVFNAKGQEAASLSVVEVIDNKMDFTVHLKEQRPGGKYTVKMRVYYADLDAFDLESEKEITPENILSETAKTVDTTEIEFNIEAENN